MAERNISEERARWFLSLTERDLSLLELLARLRYLATRQIERLFFPGTSAGARSRLKELRRRGFLQMAQGRNRFERTNSPAIWFLGPLGRRVVFELRGIRPKADLEAGLLFWRHFLAAADVYVALEEARRRGELSWFEWLAPPETRLNFRGFAARVGQGFVEPDARLTIPGREGPAVFLLEIDRGTMGSGAMRRKIRRLSEWYSLSVRSERLIFLAEEESRRQKIREWLRSERLDAVVLPAAELTDFLLIRG